MTNPVAVVRTQVRNLDSGDPAGLISRSLLLWCPGCAAVEGLTGTHQVVVETGPAHDGGPVWEWDGELERPTVNPSLLVTYGRGDQSPLVCHSLIVDGAWQYLGDCTHPMAGQTVPLPPLPDWLAG